MADDNQISYVTCAFVNSDHPPVLEERVDGYHVEERIDDGRRCLVLSVFWLVSYPHPDAPDFVRLQVLEKREMYRAKESDSEWPALYMLWQAQRNTKSRVES